MLHSMKLKGGAMAVTKHIRVPIGYVLLQASSCPTSVP